MTDPFVTTAWLADHLLDADIAIVDGSTYLPTANRNPRAEYLAAHIPGAVFFDVETIADTSSGLPHMLQSAEAFSRSVSALGIADGMTIVVYDGDGDAHYDTASAFIKSMRGCDPDASLYWLAKMLHAGEDIRFITRRMMILASEDIGMADSNALQVAVAAHQASEILGLPEAKLVLAHAVVYLATAPKSNSCTVAIGAASADVANGRTLAVPRHLRDGHYAGSKTLGHGEGYKYGHDYDGGFVPQAYLPEGRTYYTPTEHGLEKRVKERLEFWRSQIERGKPPANG
jgi:replication-associated recombination protein RarA